MVKRIFIIITFFLFCFLSSSHLFADQNISGFIRDESNGETLIGVNIYIRGTNIGTTTNKNGYYIINRVPVGEMVVTISYIGYERKDTTITVGINEANLLNVMLKPTVIQGEIVQIIAERPIEQEVKTSLIQLTPPKMRAVPQMAEPDLMRMLQSLPGVLTLSEFTSGLFIRGGTPDQNLILLDGTEVYNVNHLFGIFSTFDVDAVKQVDLMKGGFPAQYGGRMSSVLDITNMDGNQKQFEGKTSIGLISAKAALQGPIGKGSLFFSARRTYIDYMINLAEKMTSGETKETLQAIPDYYFYDLHLKLYQDMSHRNKMALTYYRGKDKLRYAIDPFDMTFQWGNDAFTGKWTHILNTKLLINGYITLSDYEIFLDEDDTFAKLHLGNAVDDITVKSDIEYFPTADHTAKIGFVYKKVESEYEEQLNQQSYIFGSSSAQLILYLQDTWTISPLFNFQMGFRVNYYRPLHFINTFNQIQYQGQAKWDYEPRMALQYRLSENTSLKGSWGRYFQYMTIVPVGNVDFSFMDIWFPSDNSYHPGEAYHYIAGCETLLPYQVQFDCEVYFKEMPHVYEFNPNISDVFAGKDLFYCGKGYAYGVDFYFEKNIGSLAGWFSYSLGWTKRKFPEVNDGKPYYPKYDRRHAVHLVTTYQFTRQWKINFAWTYGTGQAYTQPMSYYELHLPDRTVPLVIGEEKNVSRLPAYHRMDIGIRYDSQPRKKLIERWSFYLQIYNLYNRRNIWFRRVDPEQHPPEELEIRMLPIIPTFGFEIYF